MLTCPERKSPAKLAQTPTKRTPPCGTTTLTALVCCASTRLHAIRARDQAVPEDRQGYKPRLPLDAVDDVIGVGLFFPEDKSNTPYQYVSADLSGLAIDTDEPDVDQLDREDELVGQAQEAAADQRRGGAR